MINSLTPNGLLLHVIPRLSVTSCYFIIKQIQQRKESLQLADNFSLTNINLTVEPVPLTEEEGLTVLDPLSFISQESIPSAPFTFNDDPSPFINEISQIFSNLLLFYSSQQNPLTPPSSPRASQSLLSFSSCWSQVTSEMACDFLRTSANSLRLAKLMLKC